MSQLLINEMSLREREKLAAQYRNWFSKLKASDINLNLKVAEKIIEPEKFVESHLGILTAPGPTSAYQPFLDRLILFKQINS